MQNKAMCLIDNTTLLETGKWCVQSAIMIKLAKNIVLYDVFVRTVVRTSNQSHN